MENQKPTLVVLAAGMGSRYGGLKQIDPVGPHGEVVLDYSVFDAIRAGFGRVVFLIRKDIEAAFRETILPRYGGRIETALAFQELSNVPAGFTVPPERSKPWGTAHAVLCAGTVVKEPFGVINADDFYGEASYKILGDFLRKPQKPGPALYALIGFKLANTLSEHGSVARAICETDAQGFLVKAEELTSIAKMPKGARHTHPDGTFRDLTGNENVSMNMWGCPPQTFGQFRAEFSEFLREQGSQLKSEFYIPSAVTRLIARKEAKCCVLPTASAWFGVTYREDKPMVQESIRALIAAGRYPEKLWG